MEGFQVLDGGVRGQVAAGGDEIVAVLPGVVQQAAGQLPHIARRAAVKYAGRIQVAAQHNAAVHFGQGRDNIHRFAKMEYLRPGFQDLRQVNDLSPAVVVHQGEIIRAGGFDNLLDIRG